MSIVVWKILRRLPRPLLLVLLFFVLSAPAHARVNISHKYTGGFAGSGRIRCSGSFV